MPPRLFLPESKDNTKAQRFAAGSLIGAMLYGFGGFVVFAWRELHAYDQVLGRFALFVAWCLFWGWISARGKKK